MLTEPVVVGPRWPNLVPEPNHARSCLNTGCELRWDLLPVCVCVARFTGRRTRGLTQSWAMVCMINFTVGSKQVWCALFETGFICRVIKKKNDLVSTALERASSMSLIRSTFPSTRNCNQNVNQAIVWRVVRIGFRMLTRTSHCEDCSSYAWHRVYAVKQSSTSGRKKRQPREWVGEKSGAQPQQN